MSMLAGTPFLCRIGGLGRFFCCTFTLNGSNGSGMPISRPCLPMKDDVLQDPKLKLFKSISLWGEMVVQK